MIPSKWLEVLLGLISSRFRVDSRLEAYLEGRWPTIMGYFLPYCFGLLGFPGK